MSSVDWEAENAEYLALSLAGLRLRLRRRPRGGVRVGATADDTQNQDGQEAELEEAIAASAQRCADFAQSMSAPPALLWLSHRLGMTEFEQQVLLLCASIEYDTGMSALCATAPGGQGQPCPTFALALVTFDQPVWEAMSPERPLRFWRLIEVVQAPAQPLTTSPLRADERIVNFLKGLHHLDERLAVLLAPLESFDATLALTPSQQGVADAITRVWETTVPACATPAIQLLGTDSLSKQSIASRVCASFGLQALRISCDRLPQQPGEIAALARLWQRECVLVPSALYVDFDASELGSMAESQLPVVRQFMSQIDGALLVGTRQALSHLGREQIVLEVGKPTTDEQCSEWSKMLVGLDPAIAGQLAGQFNFNQQEIRRIAHGLDRVVADRAGDAQDFLWDACQLSARPRLDQLAQRLDAKATWDDLVLLPEETDLLHRIASQVAQRSKVYGNWGFRRAMNRGLGISALFAGDSGTGKTMAAEVIANELRLHLYRIDLSVVVSKYIGETEKNLRRLFDGAEEGGAILFFDEADALFGKRSEVKDSHDRFANIEINYLLQRIEAYRGVAILATNMKSALDMAFLRRLRFIVRFPFPSRSDRSRIWRRAFPPQTPLRQLDFDHLGHFNLTGGSIHSAALNAAFAAAEAGTPVTMPTVLAALRSEFMKLERPVSEADFRWLEPALGAA